MRAVLLSIRPQWCELIASGKKTIEVRKTRPKMETPFRCYIYCTKGVSLWLTMSGKVMNDKAYNRIIDDLPILLNAKVIGEFVCDQIKEFDAPGGLYRVTPNYMKDCCLSMSELTDYGYDEKTNSYKKLYGWHISDLIIYDKPKELSEFHRPCTPACNYSEECGGTNATDCLFSISRAPQSWCYVEELT